MLLAGLTGGIGSGKSAVAELLHERGAVIIDADVLSRKVVEPGTPGLEAVATRFGSDFLRADGSLDRAKLGRLVFNEPMALLDLNAIVHPLIREAAGVEIARHEKTNDIVVQVVPLLVESGQYKTDVIVVVDCQEEIAIKRMIETRGWTESEARSRMAAQTTRQQRLDVADYVLENSGTYEQLLAKVDELWAWFNQTMRERPG